MEIKIREGFGIINERIVLTIQEMQCIAAQRDELMITADCISQTCKDNVNQASMLQAVKAQINFLNKIIGNMPSQASVYDALFEEDKPMSDKA